MRKLCVHDFDTVQLTAITTYAYLKSKQAQGCPLTPNEANLLEESFHPTPLSMLLNSHRKHPYIVTDKGFDTTLDLEGYVMGMAKRAVAESDGTIACDMNDLFCEVLSKIPAVPTTPQNVPVILSNAELLLNRSILVFTAINTEYGTIVKCYAYRTLSYDDLMNRIPSIGDGIRAVIASAGEKPEWDHIVQYNGLWEDLMYVYCCSIFGIDYEIVFRNNEYNLPPFLRDRLIADVKDILPVLKETFYD